MPQYIDSYYLVESRESKVVYDFFTNYYIEKKELTDNYPIPQYSEDPEKIILSDTEILLFLEINLDYEYLIYWENIKQNSEIKQITLQYTNDGKMILGVSIEGNEPDSSKSVELFKNVRNYLNSSKACITVEEPPPTNSNDFIDFCNERYTPIDEI